MPQNFAEPFFPETSSSDHCAAEMVQIQWNDRFCLRFQGARITECKCDAQWDECKKKLCSWNDHSMDYAFEVAHCKCFVDGCDNIFFCIMVYVDMLLQTVWGGLSMDRQASHRLAKWYWFREILVQRYFNWDPRLGNILCK